MLKEREVSLLIAAQPLEIAEQICRRLVEEMEVAVDGTLLLHAESDWAGPLNTVLVKKGATVSELRRVVRYRAHGTEEKDSK